MRAYLSLEGIGIFSGRFFGWHGSRSGEVIYFKAPYFSPEILTDPTYSHKIIICDTEAVEDRWPLPEESQSFIPHLAAIIILGDIKETELSGTHFTLGNYLAANRVCGFLPDNAELLRDTLNFAGKSRAVIDHIRERARDRPFESPAIGERDLKSLSSPMEYVWDLVPGEMPAESLNIVVWDFGLSYNMLRCLKKLGCQLLIVPPDTFPERIISLHPDGVIIAGGPLEGAFLPNLASRVERIVGIRPLLGIGTGAALLAQTMGVQLYSLEVSHHGCAIPVEDNGGRVLATYQAHSLAINHKALVRSGGEITHLNVCDGSVEGFINDELSARGTLFSMTAESNPTFLKDFVSSLSEAYHSA